MVIGIVHLYSGFCVDILIWKMQGLLILYVLSLKLMEDVSLIGVCILILIIKIIGLCDTRREG